MNPTAGQVEWAEQIVLGVREHFTTIKFVISIHSCDRAPHFKENDGLTVLCSRTPYSYDQNVYLISREIQTKFWFLLAADDHLKIECLPRLILALERSDSLAAIYFTGATRYVGYKNLFPKRLGFLSTYVFNTEFFFEMCPKPRGFGGWIHTAIFFRALQDNLIAVPLEFEMVDEEIPPGYIKPWTEHGGFLAYQISMARLVNWLIPNHPARLVSEECVIGRWPFDIIKAMIQGASLDSRGRRYLAYWTRRQGGCRKIIHKLSSQIIARLFQKEPIRE